MTARLTANYMKERVVRLRPRLDYYNIANEFKNKDSSLSYECMDCGYHSSTIAKVLHRVPKGNGCKRCSNIKKTPAYTPEYALKLLKLKHENLVFPLIKNEYKNAQSEITYDCLTCGVVHKTTFNILTSLGAGCVGCATSGFKQYQTGYLYIHSLWKDNEHIGYKVGITNNNPKDRFKTIQSKSTIEHHLVIDNTIVGMGSEILKLEKTIKDNCMRIDLREFVKDGFTEIFAVSEIEKILNIISTYIVHGGL
ncbi:hypothetical protein ACR82Q_000288 [Yersinia enterocolitica]